MTEDFIIWDIYLVIPLSDAYENIVTQGEITDNYQFLLLSQCLQLYSITKPSFVEHFHMFTKILFKDCRVLLYGKRDSKSYQLLPTDKQN